MQMRTVPGRPVFSLGSSSLKAKGDGEGGGFSLSRKKIAGQQDPSRWWGALSERAPRGFQAAAERRCGWGLKWGATQAQWVPSGG